MAARDLVLIANAVAVAVNKAIASTVETGRGIGTRTVVVGGRGREVTSRCISAAVDFVGIAHTVTVRIVQARARAIVVFGGIITVTSIRGARVEVARRVVLAAHDLILFANAISVAVDKAVASTVETGRGIGTRTVVVRGRSCEIAGRGIGAAVDFIGIAHAVVIRIGEAGTVAAIP